MRFNILETWATHASQTVSELLYFSKKAIFTTKDTKSTKAASPQKRAIVLLFFFVSFVIFVVHEAFFYDDSKRCHYLWRISSFTVSRSLGKA